MQTWICDRCGQPIAQEDGYVEYLMKGEHKPYTGRGLRLVHHNCQYDSSVVARDGSIHYDSPLQQFLGVDGLMEFLSLLAEGELPKEEVLELIKRLHIPGYEYARFYFDRAIAEGVFEPNTLPGYYRQHDIQAVLSFITREG